MDAIITQVQNLAKTVDEAGRKELIDALQTLQYSIETPNDTLQRFTLQIAAARIGVDLGIFNATNNSKDPLSIEQLAQKNGAEPEVLGRILRYLASVGQIKETSKDHFSSSSTTATLANENYQGGIHHFFETVGPATQALPDFLAEIKYQSITDNKNTPFQKAFDTDLHAFEWFGAHPEKFANFQKVMMVQRAGPTWLSVFPFKQELGDFKDKYAFVDIGGLIGTQAMVVKEAFPELAGKLMLQDMPEAIQQIPELPGVEVMASNIFEPQAIKGAKFYYLRNIIHRFPNEKAIRILKNLVPALGPDSLILIDDIVLPNEKVHWQAAQVDMHMMSALGARERTDEQWRELLDSAGLKIKEIYTYTKPLCDSVIVVVPK